MVSSGSSMLDLLGENLRMLKFKPTEQADGQAIPNWDPVKNLAKVGRTI